MKKVILDFGIPENENDVQDYIKQKLNFPDYYGKNMDALYDCLTEISEPTAIGFFEPVPDYEEMNMDLMLYIDKVKEVFKEAERDNPDICVIFGDIIENENFDEEDDYFDPDDEEWLKEILKNENRSLDEETD